MTSINFVDKQGRGRESTKCQRYYISLLSKLVVNKGMRMRKRAEKLKSLLFTEQVQLKIKWNKPVKRATMLVRMLR